MKKIIILSWFSAILLCLSACSSDTEEIIITQQVPDGSVSLKIASYNLTVKSNTLSAQGNGWEDRYPYIASQIRFLEFDIFGVQESLKPMVKDLMNELKDYDYYGVTVSGKSDNTSNNAIIYRKDLFELVEGGAFWLSVTPDIPGSKMPGGIEARNCVWGKFHIYSTDTYFYFFNTHIDHGTEECRALQAQTLLKEITKILEVDDIPAILVGDFNSDENRQAYIIIDECPYLRDTYKEAEDYFVLSGTYNAFSLYSSSKMRIDNIFVYGDIKTLHYAVPTDFIPGSTPRLLSDHYPVVVKLKLL